MALDREAAITERFDADLTTLLATEPSGEYDEEIDEDAYVCCALIWAQAQGEGHVMLSSNREFFGMNPVRSEAPEDYTRVLAKMKDYQLEPLWPKAVSALRALQSKGSALYHLWFKEEDREQWLATLKQLEIGLLRGRAGE